MAAAKYTCVCGQSTDVEQEMCQCGDCLRSIHLAYASTRPSIAGNCIVCVRCMKRDPPPAPSPSRRSSSLTARARILLELKRLEDERVLQEKAAEEKVIREKEYLAKKYDLMQAQLEKQEEGSARSLHLMSSIHKVEHWLQNDPITNSVSGIGYYVIPAADESRTGTVHKPKPLISTVAVSTPKSGQHAEFTFHHNPSLPLDASKRHLSGANCVQPAESEYQVQDPLDWSLTWDVPVVLQPLAEGQYAVDLQEIQRKLCGVQHCLSKPNKQSVSPSSLNPSTGGSQTGTSHEASTLKQEVPITTPVVVSDPQPCQVTLDQTVYHAGQSSDLEALPSERQAPVAVTPLPLSCTPLTTQLRRLLDCQCLPLYEPFQAIRYQQSHQSLLIVVLRFLFRRPTQLMPSVRLLLRGSTLRHLINSLPDTSFPKNSPLFSGDPVEWPLFVSCYQNTTQLRSYPVRSLLLEEHCQCPRCEKKRRPDDELHDVIEECFSAESIGVAVTPVLKSSDEMRSMKILEDTTVRLPSRRFQTGLIWKYDHVEFPDSKPLAVHRLQSLERHILRNPEIFENLIQQIAEYMEKGYAHKIKQEEIANSDPKRPWYLPLGVVAHPKKSREVWIAWDATAAVHGKSLNSALLAGPVLPTSLPFVISRYQQRPIANSGGSQRFIFRSDLSKTPDTYSVDIASFSVICSPIHAKAEHHIRYLMSSSKKVLSRVGDIAEEQMRSFMIHTSSSSDGELREQIKRINNDLASAFINTVIHRRFNAPAAPHMGGAWKRMARSIKCALDGLFSERKSNEESLVTLLFKAESVVNSRPLTCMPMETAEHEVLTPICLLLLSTSGVNQPPTPHSDEKVALRYRWFVDSKPVSTGDLVMVVEDRLRNGWIRGRVLRVFFGWDGRCRSANIKASTGVLRRAMDKLTILEVAATAREDTEQYGSGNVQDGAVLPRFLSQESVLANDGRETTPRKNDDFVADRSQLHQQ